MNIHDAYAIYRRITCHYEEIDRIPEIFTHDFVGGNATFGRIRGLEAQRIFLKTPQEMGMVPEEHLWCMTDADNLAFRARNWAGAKDDSPFFDVIGHLIFDEPRGKFCFYHGFFNPTTAADVLGSSTTCSLHAAIKGMNAARQETERFELEAGGICYTDEKIFERKRGL